MIPKLKPICILLFVLCNITITHGQEKRMLKLMQKQEGPVYKWTHSVSSALFQSRSFTSNQTYIDKVYKFSYAKKKEYKIFNLVIKNIGDGVLSLSKFNFVPKSAIEPYLLKEAGGQIEKIQSCSAMVLYIDKSNQVAFRLHQISHWTGETKDGKAHGYGVGLIKPFSKPEKYVIFKGNFNNGIPVINNKNYDFEIAQWRVKKEPKNRNKVGTYDIDFVQRNKYNVSFSKPENGKIAFEIENHQLDFAMKIPKKIEGTINTKGIVNVKDYSVTDISQKIKHYIADRRVKEALDYTNEYINKGTPEALYWKAYLIQHHLKDIDKYVTHNEMLPLYKEALSKGVKKSGIELGNLALSAGDTLQSETYYDLYKKGYRSIMYHEGKAKTNTGKNWVMASEHYYNAFLLSHDGDHLLSSIAAIAYTKIPSEKEPKILKGIKQLDSINYDRSKIYLLLNSIKDYGKNDPVIVRLLAERKNSMTQVSEGDNICFHKGFVYFRDLVIHSVEAKATVEYVNPKNGKFKVKISGNRTVSTGSEYVRNHVLQEMGASKSGDHQKVTSSGPLYTSYSNHVTYDPYLWVSPNNVSWSKCEE